MKHILLFLSTLLLSLSFLFLTKSYSGELRIEVKKPEQKQTINWEDPNLRRKSGCGCKKK